MTETITLKLYSSDRRPINSRNVKQDGNASDISQFQRILDFFLSYSAVTKKHAYFDVMPSHWERESDKTVSLAKEVCSLYLLDQNECSVSKSHIRQGVH